MATQALVSPEEYLSTSFDGADREYVDGLIVERNVGENPHSEVQARLIEIFYELRKRHPLHCRPELRLKLAPTRYRIPDVAVFHPDKPVELVPDRPPLIVIEIVSREDRYTEVLKKLEEYRVWGVPHVWVVDPWRRTLSAYGEKGLITAAAFLIGELGIEIPRAEILP
ncbi:MAG: Uma2 family endonuclease [Acidobacteria bacterium]|nr:Uma2 family endonuclease [Acidobacteriota bacterium]